MNELKTIYQILNSQSNSDDIAILDIENPPLTYKRLNKHIQYVVNQLNEMGIGSNDTVAIVLPNGAQMAVAFLAVSSCATCAPLNPAYRASEFEFYLEDLSARALIIQPGVSQAAREVASKLSIPIIELNPNSEAGGLFSLTGKKISNSVNTGLAKPEDIALVLHTSGTTSRPKIVPLTHTNLCKSAKNIRIALNLHKSDRCMNVMPLFHIHGLMGALLSSLSAGASIVCTPGFSAPKFFAWWSKFRPNWYSAVPTMHQAILAQADTNRHIIAQSPIKLIRSSSAPLPPQIMKELEEVFNAPVIESYGMTEASHQMASNPLPPRIRKPGAVGIAAGPHLGIMDNGGNLLSQGEVGEIVIQGANVTLGYKNNSEANKNAFTNGWFRTGDLGYLDSDGYLFLKGRIKEIINRGGEKISPREVDEVLLDHRAIDQVVTFAAPHTLLGEDVAVAVVLKAGKLVTEREIKEFAAVRLADFKVPRVVIFLDKIPKGPTGKLQRIGLAEKLGLTASDPNLPRAEYAHPRNNTEEKLVEIWSNILGVKKIGINDNFFQLGGDSLLATQIINRVRDTLQVELSFLFFFEEPTISSMAIKITQTLTKTLESEDIKELLTELEYLSDEDVEKLIK